MMYAFPNTVIKLGVTLTKICVGKFRDNSTTNMYPNYVQAFCFTVAVVLFTIKYKYLLVFDITSLCFSFYSR